MKYIVNKDSLYTFKELRLALIEETKQRIIEDRDDVDIIKYAIEDLEKVYNDNFGWDELYVVPELEKYGYEIVKLDDIVDNLLTLRRYYISNGGYHNNEEKIDNTEKVLKDIEKYFEYSVVVKDYDK